MDKKKKIIIAVISAVVALVAVGVGLAFAFNSNNKTEETQPSDTQPSVSQTAPTQASTQPSTTTTAPSTESTTESTTKETTTKKKETTTQVTTVAITKPTPRLLTISVRLPFLEEKDRVSDTLVISVNGEPVSIQKSIFQNGDLITFTTEKEYTDDVKVGAKLQMYDVECEGTIRHNKNSIELRLPLNGTEDEVID